MRWVGVRCISLRAGSARSWNWWNDGAGTTDAGSLFPTKIVRMKNEYTKPLIHLVQNHQLRFLGYILHLPEEPASRYALSIPPHGNRRPGPPCTSYLAYIQRLLGYEEGSIQADQIAMLARDGSPWRSLVVTCSSAKGWWMMTQDCMIR